MQPKNLFKAKLGIVGQRGQITLDSKLAGRSVRISKMATGKYLVEEISVVPASESWAHSAKNKKIITQGIESLRNANGKTIKKATDIDLFFRNIKSHSK